MKYWICRCGKIHKEQILICECNFRLEFHILIGGQWIQFDYEDELREWIKKMHRFIGLKLILGNEFEGR